MAAAQQQHLRDRWIDQEVAADRYKWWALLVVQLSILLIGIDSTITNLALPSITSEFKVSVASSQWVIAVFFVVVALALPAAGRISDIRGRKTVFVVGFSLFAMGSALSGLAPNIGMLIAMRALQAVGAAALLANSNVISLAVFPLRQHGLALGINGTVYSVGFALGFTLGGILIQLLGWRSIFFVNVPIALASLLVGCWILRSDQLEPEQKTAGPQRFDLPGFALASIGVGGLMLGVQHFAKEQSLSTLTVGLTSAGLAGLLGFIWVELKQSHPLIDVRLFRIGEFARGSGTRLLNNTIVAACLFAIPFFTQTVLHFNSLQSGLVMLPYSLGLAVAGPIAGHLSDRFGPRWLTTLGFITGGVALLWLNSIGHGPGSMNQDSMLVIIKVVGAMLLLGSASGLFVSPNNSASLDAVPLARTGTASGVIWALSFIGSAVGTAYAAAMLRQALHGQIEASIYLKAQDTLFASLVALSVLGGVLCYTRARGPKSTIS